MFDEGAIQWIQQRFASPVLDTFFLGVSALGSHYIYMVILLYVYWAVDRTVGRRLAGLFLASMWLNGLIKEVLTLPRPDPALVRVVWGEPSPGFPSGHAQGSVTLWGYLAVAFRRRWLTILAVALVTLICFSRLYLGVHFPGDLLGGLAIGGALVAFYAWYTSRERAGRLSVRLRLLLILVIPLLLYPLYQTGTSEQLIGFFIGFLTADLLGAQAVPYRERVGPVRQALKLLIGFGGFAVLFVLHMLFLPVGLPSVFGYSLIGIWIAMGAPAAFRRFGLAGDVRPRIDAVLQHHLRHYLATAVAVLVLVVASTVYVAWAVPTATQPIMLQANRLLVIGHRGAAGLAPENTLQAVEAGLAYGADVVELDVHRTRDGAVVLLHDATVDRTTNGSGRVSEMTLAELRTLDAGYRFTPDGGRTYPYRGSGVVVPTLEEVLTRFPEARFLIDIKEADPSAADAVLAVVQATGAQGRVMISSFHDPVIERVRALAPDIPTGYTQDEATVLLIMQRLGLAAFLRPAGNALQVPERLGPLRLVDRGLIRLARDNGVQIHVWTVNDEAAMRRLVTLGVHGIITDYPDRLQQVITLLEGQDLEATLY